MNDDQDPATGLRARRIERAVIMAVLHGHQRHALGFNESIIELATVEHATIAEITGTLYWALERIGRPNGPELLRQHLLLLQGVPDAEH